MTWMDILIQVIDILLGLVISVGIPYLAQLAKKKAKNKEVLEIINRIENNVTVAVRATTQTFVEQLKRDGEFNAEAQRQAFNMTKDAVLKMISDDMKAAVLEYVGDFEVYITNLIESEVNYQK